MIKNNLKKLEKFFKTKTGTVVMLVVVAPLLIVFVATWAVYLLNIASLNARSSSITTAEDTAPISVPTNIPLTGPAGTANAKGYVASVCTKTIIPHKTIYKESSHYDRGEILPWSGTDGYSIICTADSDGKKPADIIAPAYDEIITIGTRSIQSDEDTAAATATANAAKLAQDAEIDRQARIAQCVSQVQTTFQVANAGQSSAYTYAMQRCYSIQ